MLKHLLFPAKLLDPKESNYVQKCIKLCCPQPWGSCGQQRLQKAGNMVYFFPLQSWGKNLTLCFVDLFRHLVWNQLIKAAFKGTQSQVSALPVLLPSPPTLQCPCGMWFPTCTELPSPLRLVEVVLFPRWELCSLLCCSGTQGRATGAPCVTLPFPGLGDHRQERSHNPLNKTFSCSR